MTKKLRKPISFILSIIMIVSVFTIIPVTSANAAEDTKTVTWDNNSLQKTSGGKSSGGVTLTTEQGNTRVNDCFYSGRGSATFTAPEGSVFTKIELKDAEYYFSLNFPGATVAESGGYWDDMIPEDPEWVPYYTVTWTGESSEVTFSGAVYGIGSIVFTLKSTAPTTYTVTWKNWDGSVLETDADVAEGATPEYNGNEPTKPEDDDYTYTFAGWTPEVVEAAADAEYTATFTAEDKHVAAVISMIAALPAPEDVTVNDKNAIEAAGYAYANLSNDQKALVPAESTAKLQAVSQAFAAVAKEAADQAAADGVTYLINQIPAEVTEADRETVGNAKAAYEMLTEDQKALLDDAMVEKLLAAEYALDPTELVNTSTLESELISTGSRLTVNTSAEGGAGCYTYQIFYKRTSAKYWTELKTGTSFKVPVASDFIVKVIVTDKAGNSAEVILNTTVRDPLENTSTAPGVDLGQKAVIYGSATGGAGGYTYTYYYKRNTARNWTLLGEENTTAESVGFKASKSGAYDVKVIVTDSEGESVEKLLTLGVRTAGELKNNTTISAEYVAPGTRVYVNTVAEGGTGAYSWSVRFKRPSAKNWTELTLNSNGIASFAPKSLDTYEVIAELIDADGTSIINNFTVNVMDPT